MAIDEDILVGGNRVKAELLKSSGESIVLVARTLLKAVESLK